MNILTHAIVYKEQTIENTCIHIVKVNVYRNVSIKTYRALS